MAEQATDSPHVIPLALAEPTEPVTKALDRLARPGQPGDVDGVAHAAPGAHSRAAAAHRPEGQDPRARPGLGLRRGLLAAGHADRRRVVRPDHAGLAASVTCADGDTAGRWRWPCSSAISLALIAPQKSVFGVGLLWVLFSAFQNGEYASLSAAVPDHVPVNQRATVAGWVGMPQALGLVVGTALVVYVFDQQPHRRLPRAGHPAGAAHAAVRAADARLPARCPSTGRRCPRGHC